MLLLLPFPYAGVDDRQFRDWMRRMPLPNRTLELTTPPETPRDGGPRGCGSDPAGGQPLPSTDPGFSKRFASLIALALWGLAIGAGVLYGYWYEATAGETDRVETHWPAETSLVLAEDQPTLLMFVHPRCPCSRSSLSELARLMTHCQGRVKTEVLFLAPIAFPEEWTQTDLWTHAARIPGVTATLDVDGAEHQRFGASVSGEVLLFQPDGQLRFHGGITASRGHSGDNLGRSALESFLLHRRLPADTSPVYGCQLRTPALPRGAAALAEGTPGP